MKRNIQIGMALVFAAMLFVGMVIVVGATEESDNLPIEPGMPDELIQKIIEDSREDPAVIAERQRKTDE